MDLTITLAYTRTTLCCLHSLADNDNTVCQRLSTGDNLASCSATAWLELLHGLSDVVLLLVMVVTVICDSATDHRASPTHTHTHTHVRSVLLFTYLLTWHCVVCEFNYVYIAQFAQLGREFQIVLHAMLKMCVANWVQANGMESSCWYLTN